MKKIICAVCKFEKFITDTYLSDLKMRYSLEDKQDIMEFLSIKITSLRCNECGALGTARIVEHNSEVKT